LLPKVVKMSLKVARKLLMFFANLRLKCMEIKEKSRK